MCGSRRTLANKETTAAADFIFHKGSWNSLYHHDHDDSGVYRWPEREADHSPPFRVEVVAWCLGTGVTLT
jgi:hypothetical protein